MTKGYNTTSVIGLKALCTNTLGTDLFSAPILDDTSDSCETLKLSVATGGGAAGTESGSAHVLHGIEAIATETVDCTTFVTDKEALSES